jgi:hypothetical protein
MSGDRQDILEIELRFRCPDDDDAEDDFLEYGPDPDDYMFRCYPTVQPAGESRFRLVEPQSITFAGPLGPMLNFGDIIDVVKLSKGCYGFLRIAEAARVWTRVFGGLPIETLSKRDVASTLDAFTDAGGGWEYCVGNITLQWMLEENEAEPPPVTLALLRRLEGAISWP